MATYKTDFKTTQDAIPTSRLGPPSARDIQQVVKFAVFTYTTTAALVANDIIQLGWLNVDGAVVLPELSKASINSAATASIVTKLQSVTAGGAAVDESAVQAAAMTDSANTQPFAKLATGVNAPLVAGLPNSSGESSGSFLQLKVTTMTTTPATGDVITVVVAYRCPKAAI